ncbi:sensor histidine kinase [Rhodococcus sovatensis]|uniref:histidine kinase n=1 Tax=Rhodococcus sovatensis TaxID=1805840 RepID=A0ABZ2PHH1_9NOCA
MTSSTHTALSLLGVIVVAAVLTLHAPGPWTTLLAILTALVLGAGRHGARWLMTAAVAGTIGTALIAAAGLSSWAEGARELVFALAWVGLPWLAGLAWRLRSQVRAQAAEQAQQERQQRLEREQRERDAERLALAGILHDDLGHALSLVALNLGKLELDESQHDAARKTVETAREQLTDAVGRLGASVRMLRSGQVSGLAPQSEADLAGLVDQFRAAGATVVLEGRTGSGADESRVVRVVREALTNAAKHAPGAAITLNIETTADGTARVKVTNPVAAAGSEPGTGSGTGLSALEQVLTDAGGALEAGLRDDVFRMEALVPPVDHRAVAPEPERRPVQVGRRTMLIAAGLVVCSVVVLGGLQLFAQAEARRALLPAEDYARLIQGMSRSDAQALLPDHELLPVPSSPAGVECHDYAVESDWLADQSGDVYRVCFVGDRLASTALLASQGR